MKEMELRKHANCSMCGNKILATGLPLFWKVSIQRYGVDIGAIQRQQGLTMMLGGSATLAGVMGQDENMAKPFGDAVDLAVCEDCCTKNTCIAQMYEDVAE